MVDFLKKGIAIAQNKSVDRNFWMETLRESVSGRQGHRYGEYSMVNAVAMCRPHRDEARTSQPWSPNRRSKGDQSPPITDTKPNFHRSSSHSCLSPATRKVGLLKGRIDYDISMRKSAVVSALIFLLRASIQKHRIAGWVNTKPSLADRHERSIGVKGEQRATRELEADGVAIG